jgi:5-methylthioadenosine/S-adenosylhomocysteine deaminase
MKLAALNAKIQSGDPECGRATDIWHIATRGGAEAFGLDAGEIAVGKLGDAILLDPAVPALNPLRNLASSLVYAADTSCVDTVICDGRILMRDKKLEV